MRWQKQPNGNRTAKVEYDADPFDKKIGKLIATLK